MSLRESIHLDRQKAFAEPSKKGKGKGAENMFVKYFSKDDLWETFPGSKGVVLAMGEKMLMYYIEYDPQRTFPEHSHPHEQVGYCVSGEGEIGIGDEVIKILPGCGYYIPSNIKHYEKNTGNGPFICVDIFSPVRDDLAKSAFRRDYFTKSKDLN